jgi:type II secretory pathway component GspD/PulD (secretin)
MIGGLIKEEKSRSNSKVPLLGDIPILGSAFKNESRGTQRTEIIIFITPKIISGDVK